MGIQKAHLKECDIGKIKPKEETGVFIFYKP
jgi:hypothetical protein